jgi:hypothetical protein
MQSKCNFVSNAGTSSEYVVQSERSQRARCSVQFFFVATWVPAGSLADGGELRCKCVGALDCFVHSGLIWFKLVLILVLVVQECSVCDNASDSCSFARWNPTCYESSTRSANSSVNNYKKSKVPCCCLRFLGVCGGGAAPRSLHSSERRSRSSTARMGERLRPPLRWSEREAGPRRRVSELAALPSQSQNHVKQRFLACALWNGASAAMCRRETPIER